MQSVFNRLSPAACPKCLSTCPRADSSSGNMASLVEGEAPRLVSNSWGCRTVGTSCCVWRLPFDLLSSPFLALPRGRSGTSRICEPAQPAAAPKAKKTYTLAWRDANRIAFVTFDQAVQECTDGGTGPCRIDSCSARHSSMAYCTVFAVNICNLTALVRHPSSSPD